MSPPRIPTRVRLACAGLLVMGAVPLVLGRRDFIFWWLIALSVLLFAAQAWEQRRRS